MGRHRGGEGAFTLALADLLGPGGADRRGRSRRGARCARTRRRSVRASRDVELRDAGRRPDRPARPPRARRSRRGQQPPLRPARSAGRRSSGRSPRTCGRAGAFVVVEYDADRGNPWVPHPFTCGSWERLAESAGLDRDAPDRPRPEPLPRRDLLARRAGAPIRTVAGPSRADSRARHPPHAPLRGDRHAPGEVRPRGATHPQTRSSAWNPPSSRSNRHPPLPSRPDRPRRRPPAACAAPS